jgi:hypothetical protein
MCVDVLNRVVIAVGKGLGQVKSSGLVKECVIHLDIIFIVIRSIVMNMFIASRTLVSLFSMLNLLMVNESDDFSSSVANDTTHHCTV